MIAPISPDFAFPQAPSATRAWGWKMLAVISIANAAATFADDIGSLVNPFTFFWNAVSILIAVGLSEYAFQRHILPLAFWRFFAPCYAFYIASAMGRIFRPDSPVVIAICGMAFIIASVIAIARRARYLGSDRIPFGGSKPSLT